MSRVHRLIILGALAPVPLVSVHLLLGYSRDLFIAFMGLDSFYVSFECLIIMILTLTTIGLVMITRKISVVEMSVTIGVFAILVGVYAGTTFIIQIGHSGHWGFEGRDVEPFFKYLLTTASAVVVLAALARATIRIFQRR